MSSEAIFLAIFGHIWEFSGHMCTTTMVLNGDILALWWNMIELAKRIMKKSQISHFLCTCNQLWSKFVYMHFTQNSHFCQFGHFLKSSFEDKTIILFANSSQIWWLGVHLLFFWYLVSKKFGRWKYTEKSEFWRFSR